MPPYKGSSEAAGRLCNSCVASSCLLGLWAREAGRLRSEPVGRAWKATGGGVRRPGDGAAGGGMTHATAGPYWCLAVDLSPAAAVPDAAVTS